MIRIKLEMKMKKHRVSNKLVVIEHQSLLITKTHKEF